MRLLILLLALLVGCTNSTKTKSGLDPERFRTSIEGVPIELYTLTNSAGAELAVTNFGARIVSLMVADREGDFRDVVLGFDNIDDYIDRGLAMGGTVGRNANRIREARFTLDGVEYELERNDFDGTAHNLHGGFGGWHVRAFEVVEQSSNKLTMKYIDPDGAGGFPGEVTAYVSYSLSEECSVDIDVWATTTKPTLVNFTHHSFFNLDGDSRRNIEDYTLQIAAARFTPKSDDNVPDGTIAKVAGTPFDLREPQRIGDVIDNPYPQLAASSGFDHNWMLDHSGEGCDIRVYSPRSGIVMECRTTQPAVQIYTSNAMDGSVVGKRGRAMVRRAGICVETEHNPNAINTPGWDAPILRPGEEYRHRCSYRFSIN